MNHVLRFEVVTLAGETILSGHARGDVPAWSLYTQPEMAKLKFKAGQGLVFVHELEKLPLNCHLGEYLHKDKKNIIHVIKQEWTFNLSSLVCYDHWATVRVPWESLPPELEDYQFEANGG